MTWLTLAAAAVVPGYILLLCLLALKKKKDAFGAFVRGAKQGLRAAALVLPYMGGMLFAIEVFSASGAAQALSGLLYAVLGPLGFTREVLLFMVLRPLSGSAALGELARIYQAGGPDSLAGQMASVMMGSTETILYTLPVYFGVVKITKTRHALSASLIAMGVGYLVAAMLCGLLFR